LEDHTYTELMALFTTSKRRYEEKR
jgi:hypothetical protein